VRTHACFPWSRDCYGVRELCPAVRSTAAGLRAAPCRPRLLLLRDYSGRWRSAEPAAGPGEERAEAGFWPPYWPLLSAAAAAGGGASVG